MPIPLLPSRRGRAAAVLLLFPLLLQARPARACSVCGCDPAAGTLGVDRPSSSSFRFAAETRYLSKESGSGAELEQFSELRTALRAQWSPAGALTVQLEVPLVLSSMLSMPNAAPAVPRRGLSAPRGGGLGEAAHSGSTRGLSDLSLSARWDLYRSGMDARHVVALTGTVKAPTGDNDHAAAGAQPEEHGQLGTGSWDGLAGVSYLFGPQPWTAYASLSGRWNGANARGFRAGAAGFASVGVRRSFVDEARLFVSLDAQARLSGKDRAGDGSFDEDSGGFLAYAAPSIAWAATNDLLIRALVQVPIGRKLNGQQSERPVAFLTVSYDLGY